MIPFASQRGGGQDLATHLLNDYDNDLAELVEVRGAVARDLHGAFKEWEVQASALTKCRKYLYSLSINPDPMQGPLTRNQYLDYISRAEGALGLTGQPRAVVFHTKYGREHCHVVWSRVDAEKEKAVHLAFDREKLMQVTRDFARDHRLSLPGGYEKSQKTEQVSLYERVKLNETGLSKEDHMGRVTEAWQLSDNPKAFVQALAERGYVLATGKRPYVLVDHYGGMHALPKLIDDESVRTKDIRDFLEKDFPPESLPSVEDAKRLIEAHRKPVEKVAKTGTYADCLEELKHAHGERRRGLEQEREILKERQKTLRESQSALHRAERQHLRAKHVAAVKAVRLSRYESRPTGLAGFLAKVTGLTLLRKKINHHQDARALQSYRKEQASLKTKQQEEEKALKFRMKVQTQAVERRAHVLERIEKRELAAFDRDHRRYMRDRARGEEGAMPSLAQIVWNDNRKRSDVPDLLRAFARAKDARHAPAPDLTNAFRQAASQRDEGRAGDDSGRGSPDPDWSTDVSRRR